jgi:hypothetical protein
MLGQVFKMDKVIQSEKGKNGKNIFKKKFQKDEKKYAMWDKVFKDNKKDINKAMYEAMDNPKSIGLKGKDAKDIQNLNPLAKKMLVKASKLLIKNQLKEISTEEKIKTVWDDIVDDFDAKEVRKKMIKSLINNPDKKVYLEGKTKEIIKELKDEEKALILKSLNAKIKHKDTADFFDKVEPFLEKIWIIAKPFLQIIIKPVANILLKIFSGKVLDKHLDQDSSGAIKEALKSIVDGVDDILKSKDEVDVSGQLHFTNNDIIEGV